jgi:hypothetical protein
MALKLFIGNFIGENDGGFMGMRLKYVYSGNKHKIQIKYEIFTGIINSMNFYC